MNWENPTNSRALADKAAYSPGTQTDRRRSTIVKGSLDVISVDIAIENRDDVYVFLTERAGRPFLIDPYLDGNPLPQAWRCLEFTFGWIAPGVWTFTAEFKEVGGKWI
jgi:hypothetical protein